MTMNRKNAMDRKPVDTTRTSTAFDQQVDELLRVLRLGWAGQWGQFQQFSARSLTAKGETMAMAIPSGVADRKAAAAALRAGY